MPTRAGLLLQRTRACAVEKTPEEKLSEAVRDAQIKLLKASCAMQPTAHPNPLLPCSWRTHISTAPFHPSTHPPFVSCARRHAPAPNQPNQDLKLGDAPQAALYDQLLSQLTSAHPDHLPLLTEHLKKLDGREVRAAVRVVLGCWCVCWCRRVRVWV